MTDFFCLILFPSPSYSDPLTYQQRLVAGLAGWCKQKSARAAQYVGAGFVFHAILSGRSPVSVLALNSPKMQGSQA